MTSDMTSSPRDDIAVLVKFANISRNIWYVREFLGKGAPII